MQKSDFPPIRMTISDEQTTSDRIFQTTFASIVEQSREPQLPSKREAIIVDSVANSSIQDYATSIGKIIGPINIRFISRVPNSRVCLYLSSQTFVEKLEDRKINIGSHSVTIRPLILRPKRIVISNVCPEIPNSVIKGKLLELDVKVMSQITLMKASLDLPEYSHVLSFRRQVWVSAIDLPKVPESLRLHYAGNDYWIYLTNRLVTCLLCKEEGHEAKHCKNFNDDVSSLSSDADDDDNNDNNVEKEASEEEVKSISFTPFSKRSLISLNSTTSSERKVEYTPRFTSLNAKARSDGDAFTKVSHKKIRKDRKE